MRYKCFLILVFLLIFIQSLLIVSAQDISPSLQLNTNSELYDVKWSPDGQVLAIAGVLGVKVFDANLQEIAHLKGHSGSVVSVSWNPNSQQLASAGGIDDGTIRIWDRDLTTGEFTFKTELSNNHDREFVVVWSPDGNKVASIGADDPLPGGLNGETEIWDSATWTLEKVVHLVYQEPARSLVWSSDGKTIIGAATCVKQCPKGFKTGVYFANATTGDIINVIAADPLFVKALAFHASGKLVLSEATQIFTYDVKSLHLLNRFDFSTVVDRVALSPDGSRIAFGYDGTAGGIIDVATGALSRFSLNGSGVMTGLDWHPDGTRIVTVANLGLVEIWDVSGIATVTPKLTLTLDSAPTTISTAIPLQASLDNGQTK